MSGVPAVLNSSTINTPATGAPIITGTAQVGQTLTAVTTGIMDANGLTSPTYTYQWIRVNGTDEDISGANSSTYTLLDADLGKTIKVRVTFTDDASNTETLTSAATATVAAAPDTTPPRLQSSFVGIPGSGLSLLFNETLNANAADVPVSAYSVTADGEAVTIVGLPTYIVNGVVLNFSSGMIIRQRQTVVVSYTDPTTDDDDVALQDDAGNDVASFTTGMSGVPAVLNSSTVNTPATGAPIITGTAQVGQTLTAVTTGIMDANGLTSPTYTYQWIRVNGTDEDISGANSSTYTLLDADLGKTIKVRVTFTDDASNTETLTSVPTATVTAAGTANNAPVFPVDTLTLSIAENTAADTNIGAVIPEATDADSGDTLEYSMEGTDAGSFTFDTTARQIKTSAPLDFEEKSSYSVTIRVTDGSDSDTVAVTITITDVDESLTVQMTTDLPPPLEGPFTVRFRFSETVTGFSSSDIATQQQPACTDSANNLVSCNPTIAAVQTTDDRIFTTTVTPQTDQVAHNYTLTLTVGGGAVMSSVGNKPNQAAALEVRIAPPGVTLPISSLGLTASEGNAEVRLNWNQPTEDGVSAIIRYEYRFAAAGEDFSAWENVMAGTHRVTVGGLINGREYVFEVRAVNALGKGGVETVRATPEFRNPPPPPPRGGGGGGGGLLFPPQAPASLAALPGEGAVRLEWSPPENDGGTPILRYEYRLKEGRGEFGEWTPVEDSAPGEVNASGYTVGGLLNGTVHVFEVRAVNLVGNGRESEAVEVAMPLDRAYWSNFLAEDLEGGEAGLEWTPFGGTPRSLRLRFKAGLRFEESELDGEGEVTATRMGSYGYRYTSRTTGELRLGFDGGESCELRLTYRGVGAGSYSYRCGGALRGQGSFALTGLNRVPEISGAGLFEVAENQARVGQLEAVDGDDEIAGYGIAGGADGGLFAVVEETGELLFREAPDYETPGDVASDDPQSGAGDNEYIVVVEVRSGEGERERKGSRAIRVRVADEEEAPEITSLGPFEVVENRTRVGQLEAVDQDKQDEITEYGIAGGADGALFEVVEATGKLMFREAPDYETPGDVASDDPQSGVGDNEYIVVVEVRSGEGGRERKGSRAIRVRVADEEEPPGAPGAPVVTAEGSDSLKVSWREPENRGPEIVDYEVRYREGGEAGYSDGGHEGTGLEVRLSGLEEGTVYEVQVRAVNEEGISEWSEPGEGRTDMQDPDPDDPSDFSGEDLEGRRLTLRLEGEEGTAGSLELRFGEGNRFEQIESGGKQAATRSEGVTRSGSYTYEKTGPGRGTVRLDYDDGSSCEIQMSFTETGVGGFAYDCGEGDPAEGSFRLTTGSLFVPVILSAAGQNQSFFTSELTLTNRGDQDVKLDYAYTAHRGGGSGKTSDALAPDMQKIETDGLTYLRGLGIAIPETGNRIGTLRVEARLGSEVEAVVRTTTLVPEGRAGLAYLGVAEEEGFTEAVYLCGLRQNSRDRSNVAFQNMGAPEEGAITLRATVYSGEAADTNARVLEDVTLEPGEFHQYSGLLGVLGVPAQGYVKVERVEGRAPFYAYGVINDQANSDGSFIFPVTAGSLEGTAGQTLPVVVETSEFRSELTVTNFSEEPRTLAFQFVAEGIEADDKTASFSMTLEAGQQEIVPEVVEELRRQVAGLGTSRGFYAGPLFVVAKEGDMSGIVIGARTGSKGGGGQYSVFYNAVPEGGAFTKEAWVEGLQQNEENRSNLALVNTGEVDDSESVFHLEIYDGETGMLAETVVTKPVPPRGWHQINGILGSYAPETRQGYIRIEKVSGENPFLAYGVVNDGGAPGQRSGDGAYLPARE